MKKIDMAESRMGFLDYIAVLAFIIFIVFGGYVWWLHSGAMNRAEELSTSISQMENKITDYKTRKLEEVVRAHNFITDADKDAVVWSKVIDRAQGVMPEGAIYSSFSGNEAKQVLFNVETDTIDAVMETIQSYVKSGHFDDVFVPAVNKGNAAEGTRKYSFSVQSSLDDK